MFLYNEWYRRNTASLGGIVNLKSELICRGQVWRIGIMLLISWGRSEAQLKQVQVRTLFKGLRADIGIADIGLGYSYSRFSGPSQPVGSVSDVVREQARPPSIHFTTQRHLLLRPHRLRGTLQPLDASWQPWASRWSVPAGSLRLPGKWFGRSQWEWNRGDRYWGNGW